MNRYKVLLGVPSSGTISEGSGAASWLASDRHDIVRRPSCHSGPNFNALWQYALQCGREKAISHFAMIHADITVQEAEDKKRWIDSHIDDMEAAGVSFISSPVAIKDPRGLTSTGIGNPDCRWNPWKRFTTKEIDAFPMIFNAADTGYGDKFLLHNHALCVWDMREPKWYETDAEGRVNILFNFEEEIRLVDGQYCRRMESEDWAFSRLLWANNVKTAVTRRVRILHHGQVSWPNWGDGGTYQNGDEDTASQWRAEPAETPAAV